MSVNIKDERRFTWSQLCFELQLPHHAHLCSLASTQNAVVSKLSTCAVSLGIYLSLCKLLPVERSIDDDFVRSTPFYLQVVYLYVAMLALRPKYYFVWTLGELVMMTVMLIYVFYITYLR